MSELVRCAKCSNTLILPTYDAFVRNCSCGTVYERSKRGADIYLYSDSNKEVASGSEKLGNGLTTFLLSSIPIALVVCVLMFLGDLFYNNESVEHSGKASEHEDPQTNAIVSNNSSDIAIYSGTCVTYKMKIRGSQIQYIPTSKAFGKVIINRSTKKFSFYLDGNLVYGGNNYLSYLDDQQGGEGFTLTNGYSAHSFPAEKTFQIYYNPVTGEEGVEYRIMDFIVN